MKKRLIDIYPPHDGPPAFSEGEALFDDEGRISNATGSAARPAAGRFAGILVLLAILLMVLPFVLHIFFVRASVQAWPHITKLHVTEQLVAQIGQDSVNLEKRIIRARAFQEDAEQTLLFPSSGTKFKEEKARGTIRVYNENTASPQALVANTRFISEDGKIFRLEASASIPAARMDGRRLVPGRRVQHWSFQIFPSGLGRISSVHKNLWRIAGTYGWRHAENRVCDDGRRYRRGARPAH